ncbi:MAG: endopeptidase La [Erysipelotrichaceae bacterium]|nr:endopeptidase La [Erysipelotrichaceae bacterium]
MSETYIVPLLCTRGVIIFPSQEMNIDVGRELSKKAVEYANLNNSYIFLTTQKELDVEVPKADDIYEIGTLCKIQRFRNKEAFYRIGFMSISRARIKRHLDIDGVPAVEVDTLDEYINDSIVLKSLLAKVVKEMEDLKPKANPQTNLELMRNIANGVGPGELCDYFAQAFLLDYKDKQKFLEETDINKRVELTLEYIRDLKIFNDIDTKIDNKVREHIEESQKEYYLREKMKVIKDQLSDGNSANDTDTLRNRVNDNPYPETVKKKLLSEIDKLEILPMAGGEYGVVRNYIDWVMDIPWYQRSKDNEDLNDARRILDEDHYGLKKVKERILEYLAVKQMTNSLKGPIICLVGPPGVGKTSLAKSVARALDRKFVKISLGGVRDEAEIRGHRRTYLGALPGRIIQGMKKAGTLNPVFLIDEIDKMASDFKGDPSSAMLEVLDPEQNALFSDNYIEESYNLSEVLFIATANYIGNIPPALKDRLEIINLSSYTELEKISIAKEHLIRKQMEQNGLKASQFKISDDALIYLIRHYTREAGVRQLERLIGSLCRKAVLEILANGKKRVNVSKKLINEWLGMTIYDYGLKEKKDQVGVVTGLAYTEFGGDVLAVEVNSFEGNGKLVVTGQLGDVMKESTQIALDYIKANASKYEINPEFFTKNDIHIHVPEGAVPKDGPSAGVTLTTAIISCITKRKVHCDLAMTGEVTLRGNVLPIGGLKEKSLAAHRSGITTILFPKNNVKDLEEVPQTVKESIKFIPVENIDEVLNYALVK